MRARCENPNNHAYSRYGGRGITVCDRWADFKNFLADMGECPPGLTLERIRNHEGYEPGNCKWASRSEQNLNKRHPTIEFLGVHLTLREWAIWAGVGHDAMRKRYLRGKRGRDLILL